MLRFEFQLTEGANNGIGIRTPLEGDAAYVGMEIQVLDNEAPIYSQLEKYQYHGSVYGVIAAKRGFLKPVGEWNTEEIWIKGDDIRVTLNGTVITEGNIAEASKNGTLDHRDHPGLQNKKGHIGFLGHGSEVRFRNIRIRELKWALSFSDCQIPAGRHERPAGFFRYLRQRSVEGVGYFSMPSVRVRS